jgi:post-segregation antitoxin (ccd killing protein)
MKKKKLTLSVNQDLIKEAKANNVNLSRLLEKALRNRRLFPEETNTRSTNIRKAEATGSNPVQSILLF